MNCKFPPIFLLSLYVTNMSFGGDAKQLQQVSFAETPEMYFMENKGQIIDQYGNFRADIDFKISSGDVSVFIGAGQIHYQWVKPETSGNESNFELMKDESLNLQTFRMDVNLSNANKSAQISKEYKKSYYERYYLPQTGSIETTVSSYQKVTYKDVYPGIDWVLYIRDNQLAYDFIIHPEGKVSDIKLQYLGASSLGINEDGSFIATTPFGTIVESAPYSFQDDGQFVASSFVLKENVLAFSTEKYEGALTIDPAVLWGTYYGGSGFYDNFVGSACDDSGHIYLCGMTSSINNIATSGSHQVNIEGLLDAFLVKFNESGIRLWSTYYGGVNGEWGYGVVCDTSNNVYMSGVTGSSTGIATAGSHQSNFAGGGDLGDAFLVKFDSSGTRQWATYYGGSEMEYYPYVAYADGYLYMSGGTQSQNSIATAGSFQQNYSGNGDAFLVKFSLDGIRQWATYYGGEGYDGLNTSLSCDQNGNVYIAGSTLSDSAIATAGSFQTNRAGKYDAFLVKFDENGLRQWGTYYGGTENELALSRNVSCDASGNIYISGDTESTAGIATPGSHQSTYQGSGDAFLVKFNALGERIWGTYFGGGEQEQGCMVYCTDSNTIFLTGGTASTTDIVTDDAIQAAYAGSGLLGDAFLSQFNNLGEQKWGTYYGGTGADGGVALTSDRKGNVYLAGMTNSLSGIATSGSFQDMYPGGLLYNSFLVKLCFTAPTSMLQIQGADSICRNAAATFSVTEVEDATDYIWALPLGWTGSSNSHTITVTADDQPGVLGLQVVRCGDTSALVEFPVNVFPADPPIIRINGFELSTSKAYDSYEWLLNGQPIPGGDASTIIAMENGDYSVIVVNENGCIDTSEIYSVENVGLEDVSDLSKRIRIFPNPATDKIYVQSPPEVVINLMTIEGKMITRQSETVLDVSDYPSGIYLLRVSTPDGRLIKTEKVVKMK